MKISPVQEDRQVGITGHRANFAKKGQQAPPMCSPKRLAGTNKADYNEVNRLFLLLVRWVTI